MSQKNSTTNKIKLYNSLPDKILMFTIRLMMIVIFGIIAVPLIFVLASSFSSTSAVAAGKVLLWPVEFSIEGYKAIFKSNYITGSFLNSLKYTISGTLISVTLTLFAAYPLSRKDLKARPFVMVLFTITMFFNGGMIPTYLVVNKLKMIDTVWAMVIPGAISVWNVILAKTYIQSSIPGEIYESASIDGCSDAKYFTKMILPLAKPIIAVLILMYAVGKWNDFFGVNLSERRVKTAATACFEKYSCTE